MESENYEEALRFYNLLIPLNPSVKFGYIGRAKANLELKNYNDAVNDCDSAISLSGS